MRNKRFIVLAALLARCTRNGGHRGRDGQERRGHRRFGDLQRERTSSGASRRRARSTAATRTRTPGPSTRAASVSLDAASTAPITIHAQSMVDDTTGIGALIGEYKIDGADALRRVRQGRSVAFQRSDERCRPRPRLQAVGRALRRPQRRIHPPPVASRAPTSEPAPGPPLASCSSTAPASARSTCTKARFQGEYDGRRRRAAPLVLRRRVEDHEDRERDARSRRSS